MKKRNCSILKDTYHNNQMQHMSWIESWFGQTGGKTFWGPLKKSEYSVGMK